MILHYTKDNACNYLEIFELHEVDFIALSKSTRVADSRNIILIALMSYLALQPVVNITACPLIQRDTRLYSGIGSNISDFEKFIQLIATCLEQRHSHPSTTNAFPRTGVRNKQASGCPRYCHACKKSIRTSVRH